MTDRQLKYLVILAEEGNMTAAAQKLFVSQPSLSSLLCHVERELGTELFNRGSNSLTLTPAGESYVEAARKILSIKREMENQISDITSAQRSTLQIGCGAQLSAILYPIILPEFIRTHPDVTLKLVENHFVNLCTQLARGELDLIVANRSVEDKTIDSRLLYREEIGLLAHHSISFQAERDAVHNNPVVQIEELKQLPFILVKQGQNLRTAIDDFFAVHNITPHIILETNNWDTCYRMVAQNIGFTIVPYNVLYGTMASENIRRYSLPGIWFREIRIFWSKRKYCSESLRHFVELCQKRLSVQD